MTHMNMPLSGVESNMPVVFERGGKVYANSRAVAEFFGKEHKNVLRDIDGLVASQPEWGGLNFERSSYRSAQNKELPCFDMTRSGFSVLAMGFTGDEALTFKIKFDQQFNAMESALKNPLAGFALPQTMAEALRLAADQSEKLAAQQRQIEVMAPKVDALDRIAGADGMMNMTNAAKALQVQPRKLIDWLSANKWIYRHPGGDWTAYQDKIQAGYLTHKTNTVQRQDGSDKEVWAVRVTAKGLAKLALVVPGAKVEG